MNVVHMSLLRSETCCTRLNKNRNQTIQSDRVLIIETSDDRTVKIKHANQSFILHQRYHDFRIRSAVAGDVSGKFMDVRNNCRNALCRSRTTDALAQRDSYACGPALKWSQHEFRFSQKVEPRPIQIGKRMKDQRSKVRCVSNQIMFAGEQAGKLRCEWIVEPAFRS